MIYYKHKQNVHVTKWRKLLHDDFHLHLAIFIKVKCTREHYMPICKYYIWSGKIMEIPFGLPWKTKGGFIMKSKKLALLLSAAMVVSSLAGCGSSSSSANEASAPAADKTTAAATDNTTAAGSGGSGSLSPYHH